MRNGEHRFSARYLLRGSWLAGLLLLLSDCGRGPGPDSAASGSSSHPTFTRDVAPIVFAHCAPCHRPDGAGPFSLLTYADVKRRARQIVEVTGARYMPPWPPVPGHGTFMGERRLSDANIATLARWVARGSAEGEPRDLPVPPTFAHDQRLGSPDLVLSAPDAWTLPAEGGDVFHNFVMSTGLGAPRHVRAVEIRPGNPRIVHHANALVDTSGAGRERDASEPGTGFSGMDLELASGRFEPDSHFLFWKPGSGPTGTGDLAWTIAPGTDLILNLHLRTSGKPETLRPSIGLYFTDRPPARFPMLLQLEHDGALDIPPGATAFTVSDELELPVPVQVLAVYPHAHYIGREIQGIARLPDGTTRWLIHIADWNLDWQAVYELAAPLSLPAGTVISMRWTYDNSSGNERNPHVPPQRVVAGNRASDEMSHLWIQVLPERREDQVRLQESSMRARLRKYPGDFVANANLGALFQSAGRIDEALAHLRAALASRPGHPAVRNNLGTALRDAGRPDEAIAEFNGVIRDAPNDVSARYNLATTLMARGRAREAIPHLERVLTLAPDDAAAMSDLGSALGLVGRYGEAVRWLERSVQRRPENAYAHYNLGLLAARRSRFEAAESHFRRALEIEPDDKEVQAALADVRRARAP
jgi:Flp pilus assembly protein TadD/mono/diheme cytochrome c family protein